MDTQLSSERRFRACLTCVAMLAAIAFVPGATAAALRSFHMALYFGSDPRSTDMDWFFPSESPVDRYQPSRRAILDISSLYTSSDFQVSITAYNYDWSRIAAVVIDEPYAHITTDDTCPSAADQVAIQALENKLAHAASVITSLSPSTRFWVNFSRDEVFAISNCSTPINRPYIDVISFDDYSDEFDGLRARYDWLLANKPHPDQQLALVPGTFHKTSSPGQIDAATAAARLHDYFSYADEMNAGDRNRPVVWLIAGFPADVADDPASGTYNGLAAPGSEPIRAVWDERWSRRPWAWSAPVILSLY